MLEKLVAKAVTIHQESHLLVIRLRTKNCVGACFQFVLAKKSLCLIESTITMHDLRPNAKKAQIPEFMV